MENDLSKMKYEIRENSDFGYKHIFPIPSQEQLSLFYKEHYYRHLQELLKKGRAGRNPKLNSSDESVRKKEQEWMEKTYFSDILVELADFMKSKKGKILDIGCGTGDFLHFMKKAGWETLGTEPSQEARAKALLKEIKAYPDLQDVPDVHKGSFDAVTLINVLEHVIDPRELLDDVKKMLKPGGLVYVQVPNDFSKLQEDASGKIKERQWWVAPPAHISYFNFESLEKLLKSRGFEIMLRTTDFPMELFLLMGENYVDNPLLGKECHRKRVEFEYSISGEARRNLYNKLAESGMGRDCKIYAKKI